MGEKIYVCKKCAEDLGADTSKPYMYHICGKCGDGPCDLYEAVDPDKKEEEQKVQDAK